VALVKPEHPPFGTRQGTCPNVLTLAAMVVFRRPMADD